MSSGKIDVSDVADSINKSAGEKLAYNLNQDDPTKVPYWISTGCFLLDTTIKQEVGGGIPAGKVIELAGEEATGKSFFASLIAANAQKSGDIDIVVYFDSEEAQNSGFMENAGIDLNNIVYVQAKSVEFVFETIENLLGEYENVLFIWDSIAMTGLRSKKEGGFGERKDIAAKARVMADSFDRITIPLGNADSTLICTNQLRDYIPKKSDPWSIQMTKPHYTPGGRALNHVYSLRIWLKRRDASSAAVYDENDNKIGAEVKAELKKSRFGSEDKTCVFDIIWGSGVGIREKEYWIDILKDADTDKISFTGNGWFSIPSWGKNKRTTKFIELLAEDEELNEIVMEVLGEQLTSNNNDEESE